MKKQEEMVKIFSKYSLRVVKEDTFKYEVAEKVTGPEALRDMFNRIFELEELAEEQFVMITFDTKNQINGAFVVSQGSLNASVVHPREVFKRALLQNANKIAFAHNHPSGDCLPSQEDISITKRLQDAGQIIGIEVFDHIIIGSGTYYSFKEYGRI